MIEAIENYLDLLVERGPFSDVILKVPANQDAAVYLLTESASLGRSFPLVITGLEMVENDLEGLLDLVAHRYDEIVSQLTVAA